MKAFHPTLRLLGLLISLSTVCYAQQYTMRDQEEIAYQAQLTLNLYQDLLNVISFKDLATESEIRELIRNSYSATGNQLFYSAEAIVEDNSKPANLLSPLVQDKTIKDYLQYFDLAYVKSKRASIEFSGFETSDLKMGSYLYIKVKYTCLFKGRHKEDTTAYKPVDQLAEFRVEKQEGRWKTFITSIVRYNPEKPLSSKKGNVRIRQSVPDSNALVTFSGRLTQAENKTGLRTQQPATEKQQTQDSLFSHYLKAGSIALGEKRLEEAYTAFSSAEKIYPFHQDLWQKLSALAKAQDLRIGSIENSFAYTKREADKARFARDYTKARQLYTEALRLKPEDEELKKVIGKLDKTIQELALLESKYAVGDYQQAISEYNKAIEKNSTNPDYYLGRGKCFLKLREPNSALYDFNRAIELDNHFTEALSSRARLYTELGQYHLAIADYSLILSHPDHASEFYPERAGVKKMMGDLQGAINDLDAAIREKPENAGYYFDKAMVLLDQERIGEAISVLSEAIGKNQQHVGAFYQRGIALVALGNIQAASGDFERARALGLEDASLAEIHTLSMTFFKLGERAMEKNDYREALENFDKALLLSPAFSKAWERKGDACFMLEWYDSAILFYGKAVEHDHISLGYFKRGLAYQKMNDDHAALQDFKRFIPAGKAVIARAEKATGIKKLIKQEQEEEQVYAEDLADACYALGYAQLLALRYIEALPQLDKAIRKRKSFPKAYHARGAALYALADYKGAIKDLEKATKQGLLDPKAYYMLGRAYQETDQPEEAAVRFTRAIQLAPEYAAAYEERANCHHKRGEYDLAIEDIHTALTFDEALKEQVEFMTQKGLTELHLYRLREAHQSFDQALHLDKANTWALYGKACAFAQEYNLEEALTFFRRAFQSRQINWSVIKKDPLLAPVSKEKAFKELVQDYLRS